MNLHKNLQPSTRFVWIPKWEKKFMSDWIIIFNYLHSFPIHWLIICNSPICLNCVDTILKHQTEFIFPPLMISVTIANALKYSRKNF